MSGNAGNPSRPRRGRLRTASGERRARHLRLVTDEWLAEIATQKTMLSFSRRGPLPRRRAPRAAADRTGSAQLRPA